MARPPKKSDGDWMDALKLAMQIDPSLRKQRDESEARDRSEHAQPEPVDPRAEAPRDRPTRQAPPVDPDGDDHHADADPLKPATPLPPPAEFPWERPTLSRADNNGSVPKMTLNFRGSPVDEPPPPAPIPMPRPTPAPTPPVVQRPSVRTPDRVEPDRSYDRPIAGRPYLARSMPNPNAQRLATAIEPLLQLVCRLNRMKRTGVLSDRFRPESLRVEFETTLAFVVDAGDTGAALEVPLRAFADVVMTRAGFPFARRWVLLTDGTIPPERIFQQAASAAASSNIGRDDGTWATFYACLCLIADLIPPAGNLPSGTELLDELDAGIYTKPSERYDRVCPQAYEGVFDHPLLPSVGKRLRSVAVASVVFLLIAVAIAVALNVLYLRQMDESIGNVRRSLSHPDAKAADVKSAGDSAAN